jgi:hypothetical protein
MWRGRVRGLRVVPVTGKEIVFVVMLGAIPFVIALIVLALGSNRRRIAPVSAFSLRYDESAN